MSLCSMCWGKGVVDEGSSNERECPNCCGTGFEYDDDDDDSDD